MLSTDDLRQIKIDCESAGHKILVKDISFVIVKRMYDDNIVAYKSIYNDNKKDKDIEDFTQSPAITFLSMYVESMLEQRGVSDNKKPKKRNKALEDDITFEENKAELIKLIKETQEKEKSGEIDAKQSLDLQTKLRITLNDKFKVQEEVRDNVVIVNQKFDDICSCGREIARRPITKEEAMAMYRLVEKE